MIKVFSGYFALAFSKKVGLPTTLADIGLEGITDEELMKVAERAVVKGESIHHELVPITAEGVVASLKMADAMGRYRLE